MPIYPRPSKAKHPRRTEKRWLVVVEHGRQRDESIFYGTRREAEDYHASVRLKVKARGPNALRAALHFSDFCAFHYRQHAELRLKRSTWKRVQSMLATLVGFFAEKRLDKISRGDVEAYQQVRREDGLKNVSINNETRVLRRVLNYAGERGIAVSGKVVTFLKEPELRVRVWTDKQVKALLAALVAEAPEILALVVFLLNTGCRKGEALALKWECVDLKRRFVHIWPNDEWQPKSGKPREVPIPDALLPFLKGPRASKVWVFPSRTGAAYVSWPKLQFDRARKRAGLVGGPHTCRHVFASFFLKRQPDLFLLAKVMGHSDVTVTKRYAHLLPEHLDKARNAVNFRSPLGPKAIRRRAKARVSALASRAGSAPRRRTRPPERPEAVVVGMDAPASSVAAKGPSTAAEGEPPASAAVA